jgi:ElaB/YqjD/DUF883 family membrane-anchored ribosome-binding protein
MNDATRDLEFTRTPRPEAFKEMALDCAAVAREQLAESGAKIKAYVVQEPVRAVALAFGAGLFLGWLLKRR